MSYSNLDAILEIGRQNQHLAHLALTEKFMQYFREREAHRAKENMAHWKSLIRNSSPKVA